MHFKKDVNVKSEIGVMLSSSLDGKDWDGLSFEEQVYGPPEYSGWENRNSYMQEEQRKDLLEKWQILGLSFMMMSKTPEDFHDLVKQEFGYIWDGKGWIKEVSYQ